MKWGPEQDQDILVYILQNTEVKVPYGPLAEHLGVTAKALTHRIANIKKMVLENRAGGGSDGTSSPNGDDDDEVPAPKKRKRASPKKKTDAATPKKAAKKAVKAKAEEVEQEEDTAEAEAVSEGEIPDEVSAED